MTVAKAYYGAKPLGYNQGTGGKHRIRRGFG